MTVIRGGILIALGGASIVAPAGAADSPTPQYQLDIPRQPLSTSLATLARETGLQIARYSDATDGSIALNPVHGVYSASQALEMMLAGTDYRFRFVDDHTIAVYRNAAPSTRETGPAAPAETAAPASPANPNPASRPRRLAALLAALGASLTGFAWAQDAGDAAAPNALEEVIVTARNRVETLQTVPLSITAIPAAVLENEHIETVQDLVQLDPSLVFDRRFGLEDTEPTIRGLSSERGRPAVGILIDGVDMTSESMGATAGGSQLLDARLLDLERVEVVKGPQSALYGRAAFGGAIDYITKKPSDTFGASFSAGGGQYGEYEFRGAVTGPIADHLDFRINGFYSNSDGYYKNQVNDQSVGGYDSKGVMVSLSFDPSAQFRSLLQLSFSKDHTDPAAQEYFGSANGTDVTLPFPASFLAGAPGAGGPISVQGPPFGTYGLSPSGVRLSVDPTTGKNLPGAELTTYRAALNLDYDFGWAHLKSITSYLHALFSELDDDDFFGAASGPVANPAPGGNYEPLSVFGVIDINHGSIAQFSQDLRLGNLDAKTFRWAAGVLYWHEDYSQNDQSFTSVGVVPSSSGALNFLDVGSTIPYSPGSRTTDSISYYGLAEYEFLDKFTASLEGRYFDEKYSYVFSPYLYSYFANTPDPATIYQTPTPASTKADYFTPKFTLRYKASDTLMTYVSAGEGEKPGGYNTVSIVSSVGNNYGPEKLWNYELGTKYQTENHRLAVDAALFWMNYTHKQENVVVANPETPTGFASEIENVGSAVVKGIELNVTLIPVEGLTLNVGYTYLDDKYTNYPLQIQGGVTAGVYAPLIAGCTPNTAIGTGEFCVTNLKGNRLEMTPTSSAVVMGRYARPVLDDIKGFVEADARYTSNRPMDEYNVRFIPSQTIANAQIGLESERWTALIYVENLFNQDKIQGGFLAGDFFHQGQTEIIVTPADPRRAGARVSYKW
jgi:outer membrane receptor protein involved in Fe transport